MRIKIAVINFCVLIYTLTAFVFAVRTYIEGYTSKEGGPVLRVVGLLLCSVWPAIVFCATIEVIRSKQRSHFKPEHLS